MTEPAPHPPGAAARAKGVARRVTAPVLDRLGDQAAEALRPELDAQRAEIDALRAELDRTRSELQAEIELLHAQLAGPG